MYVHLRNFSQQPAIMALLKYFKHIEPSKEERIQSALPKPDCTLACQAQQSKLLIASAVYEMKQSSVSGSWYMCMHL